MEQNLNTDLGHSTERSGSVFDALGILTEEQCDALTHDQMVDVLRRRGDNLSLAVANTLVCLSAQDGLIEKAQLEAEQLSSELREVKRPLSEQMARLNARVIELLAACQAVEQAQRDGNYESAFKAVRAAIAKATGAA